MVFLIIVSLFSGQVSITLACLTLYNIFSSSFISPMKCHFCHALICYYCYLKSQRSSLEKYYFFRCTIVFSFKQDANRRGFLCRCFCEWKYHHRNSTAAQRISCWNEYMIGQYSDRAKDSRFVGGVHQPSFATSGSSYQKLYSAPFRCRSHIVCRIFWSEYIRQWLQLFLYTIILTEDICDHLLFANDGVILTESHI